MPYDIKKSEKAWMDFWQRERIFQYNFNSEKPTFSIDVPPRYASGRLHIGHSFHYTHMDFVARYKRLRGFEVFFPLCFDVNGMPIEVNVEKKYKIRMKDYKREEFNKLCEQFANENINGMIEQFNILGVSLDQSLYYRTDAEYYRKITQITFLELLERNLAYRALHPVNWCPRCETALAESEIVYEERDVFLNDIIFKGDNFEITISTTRPELLPACLAIAVNPNDERYKHLIGKEVEVPLFGKKVKIIGDENVLMDFGTGAEMVCSVGDKDDLKMIYSHGLPFLKSLDERGRLTSIAGKFAGLDADEAKKAILEDLKSSGFLISQKKIKHNVGTCWRCGHSLEFLQKEQWFIKTLDFKEELIKAARQIKWYPEFMRVRLEEWINSLSWDWVISRQRYFATPIPVWYCKNGHIIPAKKDQCYVDPLIDKPPVEKCPICNENLEPSDEVFDTWMDSSISPMFLAFYARDPKLFEKLYPLSFRPQGQDIIRTWAFYTILRSKLLTGKIPWYEIMVDGNIMAPDGRPMHASWGNVIDPLVLIDKYGADPFRYFTSQCSLGEDTPFKERDMVRGQRFINKIYNIVNFLIFANGIERTEDELRPVDHWINQRLSETIRESTLYMEQYSFDKAMKIIEDFVWHDLADNYIEVVKHRISGKETFKNLYNTILKSIIMLSPMLPFISEDSYQRFFRDKEGKKSIQHLSWPEPSEYDENQSKIGESTIEAISILRSEKAALKIPLNQEVENAIIVPKGSEEFDLEEIMGTLNIKNISILKENFKTEIVDIKLSANGYKKFKGDSNEILKLVRENPSLLKERTIKGYTLEEGDFEIVEENSFNGKKIKCGKHCCASIYV